MWSTIMSGITRRPCPRLYQVGERIEISAVVEGVVDLRDRGKPRSLQTETVVAPGGVSRDAALAVVDQGKTRVKREVTLGVISGQPILKIVGRRRRLLSKVNVARARVNAPNPGVDADRGEAAVRRRAQAETERVQPTVRPHALNA